MDYARLSGRAHVQPEAQNLQTLVDAMVSFLEDPNGDGDKTDGFRMSGGSRTLNEDILNRYYAASDPIIWEQTPVHERNRKIDLAYDAIMYGNPLFHR